MGQTLEQLHATLDRRWRGGHPFRPRLSRKRRAAMLLIFIILCAIIGTYWYLTDSSRVRSMAETYLSKILGGRVEVHQANLSIFEGLRLDGVKVHADDTTDIESILFSADTFKINYNPRALLTGKLEATQIIAIGPELRLTEDLDTHQWNYQRILARARLHKPPTTRKLRTTLAVPEILLRDGRVENGQVLDGNYKSTGLLGFEGRLSPTGTEGRYAFELQCHGPSDPVGPAVTGWVAPDTGQVRLRLRDFAFGHDIRGMLPFEVRNWWEQHALAGKITTTDLSYSPSTEGLPPDWRVETSFAGVTFTLHPEEWRGPITNSVNDRIIASTQLLQSLTLTPESPYKKLFRFTQTTPVQLQNGGGTLTFDPAGIRIQNLHGTVENSSIAINGRYSGYKPDGDLDLHLTTTGPNHLQIPETPKYIWNLPIDIQELWRRFRPMGTIRLSFDISKTGDAKPKVAGQVEILDGEFTCDRFPYTLRQAHGLFIVGHDETNGDKLEIHDLRGLGRLGTVNADTPVHVNGLLDHLGADPGMYLEIAAKNVVSDSFVLASMPQDIKNIVSMFDADGKWLYPQFSGSFTCWIKRPPGHEKHIDVSVDLDITKGAGRLVSFPYPLDGVSAKVQIKDDYVDILSAHMDHGGKTLDISGRVRWEDRQHTGEKIGTNLKLDVKGMPIDHDLLAALPAMRRAWLEKVGLGGTLDFGGRVYSDKTPKDIVVDLDLGIRDGVIWPNEKGQYAVTGIEGALHLAGESMELKQLQGKRGEGRIGLSGMMSWKDEKPRVELRGTGENLMLDSALYQLLPAAGREGWDQVGPEGTVDLEANYKGSVNGEGAEPVMSLVVRPRKLAVTLKALPYRLEDLKGQVSVEAGKVKIEKVSGKHGAGSLRLDGLGVLGGEAAWSLKVGGEKLVVDDAFMKGVPDAVASVLKELDYKGGLGFDLPKMVYRQGADGTADVDFGGTILPEGGSLDAGVPMSEVKGKVKVAGAVRGGRLAEFSGQVDVGSMLIAGREAKAVKADLSKPAGEGTFHITKLQGQMAGGELAATVDVGMPEEGVATGYAVNVVLRNADVSQVAGDKTLDGKFTASMDLEGNVGDAGSRRGRGDVLASGKEMYKVPLMMGLLQVAQLSLPFTSPFKEATAQYILQGNLLTFENIELKSDRIVMRGAGSINFDNKKVRLTFDTDSPTHWLNIPLFRDLVQTARRELFQISIHGTVQDPKVSATPFHTVTTTVDEVLNGGEK